MEEHKETFGASHSLVQGVSGSKLLTRSSKEIRSKMDYVVTLKPNRKDGIRMKAETYQSIKRAMLGLLDNDGGISSQQFFRILHDQFRKELGANAGWYLYQVKVDIEVRGLITTLHSKRKTSPTSVIRLIKNDGKFPPEITASLD